MSPREALVDAVRGLAISAAIIAILLLIAFLVRVPQGVNPEQHEERNGKVPFCSARQGCFA